MHAVTKDAFAPYHIKSISKWHTTFVHRSTHRQPCSFAYLPAKARRIKVLDRATHSKVGVHPAHQEELIVEVDRGGIGGAKIPRRNITGSQVDRRWWCKMCSVWSISIVSPWMVLGLTPASSIDWRRSYVARVRVVIHSRVNAASRSSRVATTVNQIIIRDGPTKPMCPADMVTGRGCR